MHRTDRKSTQTQSKKAEPESNPKLSPAPDSNGIKEPDEWVSGHEPMTGAQASYLKTLSEQTDRPEAYDPQLDKAEASKRIDGLKHERGDG